MLCTRDFQRISHAITFDFLANLSIEKPKLEVHYNHIIGRFAELKLPIGCYIPSEESIKLET